MLREGGGFDGNCIPEIVFTFLSSPAPDHGIFLDDVVGSCCT